MTMLARLHVDSDEWCTRLIKFVLCMLNLESKANRLNELQISHVIPMHWNKAILYWMHICTFFFTKDGIILFYRENIHFSNFTMGLTSITTLMPMISSNQLLLSLLEKKSSISKDEKHFSNFLKYAEHNNLGYIGIFDSVVHAVQLASTLA